MPWKVMKGHGCPDSKPWAVVNQSNGNVEGCHPSKNKALKQSAALYASEANSMSDPIIERRRVPVDEADVRQENGVAHFTGHAAVFNSVTNLGPFREQVAPGAFKSTIRQKANVAFLYNHNEDTVMATTKTGSLRLSEDRTGLATEADLDPTDHDVQRILPKMRAGNLDQMSFAFRVVGPDGDSWEDHPKDGGPPIRTLKEVALYDVSVVTSPAYEATDAAIGRSVQKVAERRMRQLEIEDEEQESDEPNHPVVPVRTEPDTDEDEEETEEDTDERVVEPLTADEPHRDEHALAEQRALMEARVRYLEQTL